MERPQYIPHFEVEGHQNPPIEAVTTEGSTMDMSEQEIYDQWWNEQRQLNHMNNMNLAHGVYINGAHYHQGCKAKRRGV